MSEVRFPVGSPIILPSEQRGGQGIEKTSQPSFDSILSREIAGGGIKLSSHALNRLRERGIDFTGEDISRIKGVVETLESKGGRDSLILMGNTALIINVPNRTVVTAMDAGNVFTNIDSAAVISH